jgi:hypothetical protein
VSPSFGPDALEEAAGVEAQFEAIQSTETLSEFLLRKMRDTTAAPADRFQAAKAAAPFCHPQPSLPTRRRAEDRASYSFVLRGYVRHWLDTVWAEYDRVSLTDIVAAKESPAPSALSLGAVSFLMRLCLKLLSLACFISRHLRGVTRLFCAAFFVTLAGGFLRQPPKSIRFSKSNFCCCAKLPLGCAFGPGLKIVALAVHRYALPSSTVAAA